MTSPKTYQAVAKTAHNRYRNELAKRDLVEPTLENLDPHEQALWEYGLSVAVSNPSATPEQIHAAVRKYDADLARRRGVLPTLTHEFGQLSDEQSLRYTIFREAADTFGADVLSAGNEQEIDALPADRTKGTAFELEVANPGANYTSQPTVTFSPSGSADDAALSDVQADLDAEDPDFREGQRMADSNENLPQGASEAMQRGFYSRKDVRVEDGAVASV